RSHPADQSEHEPADVEEERVRLEEVERVEERQEDGLLEAVEIERRAEQDEWGVERDTDAAPAAEQLARLRIGERELCDRGRHAAEAQEVHPGEPVGRVLVRAGGDEQRQRDTEGE